MREGYQKYLRSDHWRAIRLQKLATADAICHFCRHRSLSNDVHHVKYPSRLQDTKLRHLRVLCRSCHDHVHNVLKEFPAIQNLPTTRERWRITEQHVRRRMGQKYTLNSGDLSEYRNREQKMLAFSSRRLSNARAFSAVAFRFPITKEKTPNELPFSEWLSDNLNATHVAVILMASALAKTGLTHSMITKNVRRQRWRKFLHNRWKMRVDNAVSA